MLAAVKHRWSVFRDSKFFPFLLHALSYLRLLNKVSLITCLHSVFKFKIQIRKLVLHNAKSGTYCIRGNSLSAVATLLGFVLPSVVTSHHIKFLFAKLYCTTVNVQLVALNFDLEIWFCFRRKPTIQFSEYSLFLR